MCALCAWVLGASAAVNKMAFDELIGISESEAQSPYNVVNV